MSFRPNLEVLLQVIFQVQNQVQAINQIMLRAQNQVTYQVWFEFFFIQDKNFANMFSLVRVNFFTR